MSAKPVIEFDHHSNEYAEDPWETGRELAAKCPVAWSDSHGGFWVVSGYKQITEAAKDAVTFSSRHDLPTGCTHFLGTQLPAAPSRYLPIEADTEEHLVWRGTLSRFFTKEAVTDLEPTIQQFTDQALDAHIETGTIDFVQDFSCAVSSMLTLHLLGLPLDDWSHYAELTHRMNGAPTEERIEAFMAFDASTRGLVEIAKARRGSPGDDVLSCLATIRPGGELLDDVDLHGAISTLIAGGIDTTAATVAGGIKYLGEHPEARERLIAEPDLIPTAVEEFVRYVTPAQVLARTAATDVELGGHEIAEGERVLLVWAAGNMDERVFDDPKNVKLDRTPNRHLAFGYGPHRCLGANLARAEAATMLRTVLERMPDYKLEPGAVRYPSIAAGHNYLALPATFTPGQRTGHSA